MWSPPENRRGPQTPKSLRLRRSHRGGRTSKLHGLTDGQGRPRVPLISPGNINDMRVAEQLIAAAARVATRYDKLAANDLAGALIAASLTYCCK